MFHKLSRKSIAAGLILAFCYVLCFFRFGFCLHFLLLCLFYSILLFAAIVDFDSMYIPDSVHFVILLLAVLSFFDPLSPSLMSRLMGAVTAGGFLMLLSLISHGGVGFGDIKLLFSAGFLLGFSKNIMSLLLGYSLAGSFCVFLLFFQKLDRKTAIPMAPFFAISFFLCSLWGDAILMWYLGFFLYP
ncbi:MAG: A24 family peptidase [bacterium]|nr:A24 family peptidase [bacterium]